MSEMSRRQAIDALQGVWWQRDSEFVVTAAEGEASEAEMYAAFAALGVTRAEVDGAPVSESVAGGEQGVAG